MKYLIIVDVQNDFVDGALGTAEAQAMLPRLTEKAKTFDGTILVTKDTHGADYMNTQEGRNLPVPHCILGTEGWKLAPSLLAVPAVREAKVYEKPCFGSTTLAADLAMLNAAGQVDSVELVGLCTDICVVSNALLIKAAMPEVPVSVDASCCAGVTPEKHEAALAVMESCQVQVIR
ncbi:MAG: cysteine hydrolase [Lachnospiraceae bacterium]|nr:cysteine hydrolase [Lachnospiraceae bacterium]